MPFVQQPFELRDNWRGDKIVVYKTPMGDETTLFNLTRPVTDIYEDIKQKINYYTKKEGPVPKPLRWIPAVINILDDTQDILYTGLMLAKPLLKKLPSRLIPGVGWAMVANDLLNAGTMTLGQAMTFGFKKPKVLTRDPKLRAKLLDPNRAFSEFMGKSGLRNKFGALLQGLQAADTLFNNGMKLGQIMGGISNGVWGTFKMVWDGLNPVLALYPFKQQATMRKDYQAIDQAARDIINGFYNAGKGAWNYFTGTFGPKRSTMEMKAARLLLQMPQLYNIIDGLDDEDVIKIIAAQNIAVGVLAEIPGQVPENRIDAITMLPFPRAIPVNPLSVRALREAGIDIEDMRPCLDPDIPWPSIGHSIDEALDNSWNLELKLRERAEHDMEKWAPVYLMARESGADIIEKITGVPETEYTTYDHDIVAAAMVADMDFQLIPPWKDKDLQTLFLAAMREAEVKGLDYPREEDWIAAAEKNGLKWRRKIPTMSQE